VFEVENDDCGTKRCSQARTTNGSVRVAKAARDMSVTALSAITGCEARLAVTSPSRAVPSDQLSALTATDMTYPAPCPPGVA
jgi:hypothetical protein